MGAVESTQLPVPEHVVRAKARLMAVLVVQLKTLREAVKNYNERIRSFFASMPAAELVKTLPGAKTGTIVATLWAELGDAKSRWESFRHLQAEAGVVPVTRASGKSRRGAVSFLLVTSSCATPCTGLPLSRSIEVSGRITTIATNGLKDIATIKRLRALGAKWLKIIFVMWRDHKPYDENYHLANITRQKMRQAA